jgi:hypothetical protein
MPGHIRLVIFIYWSQAVLRAASRTFLIDDFSMGLDWTTPSSRLRPGYVADAKNVNLNQFKAFEK